MSDPSRTGLMIVAVVIAACMIMIVISLFAGCHLVESVTAGVSDTLAGTPGENAPTTGAPTETKALYIVGGVVGLVAVAYGWKKVKKK